MNKQSTYEKTISVVGLGYVGLVTAAGFGLKGYRVIGIDVDENKIDCVNAKNSPLYEEGLTEAMGKIDILATTDFKAAADAGVIFLCVCTPSNGDGSMDTGYLKNAVERLSDVIRHDKNHHLIVVRSTVAPGTTEQVVLPLANGHGVCMNPEFMREGKALWDFQNPSRIVIGDRHKSAGDQLSVLYEGFEKHIMRTDIKTAEMIKYASNAFLASKISFINEIGNICKLMGIDTYEVAKGMGYDGRIGSRFLKSGIGWGGSCFPKDIRGLVSAARALGYEPEILASVLQVNERQPGRLVGLLEKHVEVKGSTIGVLGLAFKPGTDDVRDARSINIVQSLLQKGAQVRAYDPRATANFAALFPQVEYTTPARVLQSDAVLILTEWPEFEKLDYSGKTVIDGRKITKAREAKIYEGICW